MRRDGPAGLVHGNRGTASPRRLPEAARTRILELAEATYFDVNDTHLAELLAEREGIEVSRVTLRRLLRDAGRSPRRRRRAPRHHGRRDRMPREGMLLQTDGSRHDWLGDRGPRLTLVGMIDDATGRVTAATFREQEDTAGYLEVLAMTLRRHGVPGAVYHDRAGVFEPALRQPLTLEEQLFDTRVPTQLGRAFAELGIGSIAARSPQAKGRIERLWGTLQDRLIPELRLAGVEDRDGANAFLGRYLARHNRRFAISPAEPEPAWRRMAGGTPIERACCFKYRRTVARDGTVRAGATILQVPAQPNGRSRAGQRVELHVRLDGRLVGVLEAEAADSATIVDAVVAAAVSGERPDWNRLGVEQAERVAPASDGGSMGLLGDVLDLMARAGRGLGAVTESQVIEVPSKSHPGEVNIVRISAGVATCTCKGFEYRGDCSHDRQAAKDAAAWPKHRFT